MVMGVKSPPEVKRRANAYGRSCHADPNSRSPLNKADTAHGLGLRFKIEFSGLFVLAETLRNGPT